VKPPGDESASRARPLLSTAAVLLGLSVLSTAVAAQADAVDPPSASSVHAELGGQASAPARTLAAWVTKTGDHAGMPFLLVDKVEAKVFAFDGRGRAMGVAPVLLGLGLGDDSPPGIGDRRLSTITPAERVTPAGRFLAALGENLGGKDVLWVDYEAAISLHRVDTATPAERRLQRLATPSAADNRISYGCINVPVAFYETVVRPLFRGTVGVVYILPEARGLEEVFFSTRTAAAPG
jgi:hypothetical protein